MITKSKIAVNAAIEALSFASPALAQSFDNSAPETSCLRITTATAGCMPVCRGGMSAFASLRHSGFASESNTGGGSGGYDEMLQNDQW
jgi:hypothetical protein